jgi:hypothetical protein
MPESKVVGYYDRCFEYPPVPYWFTVKQAIMVIKKSVMGTEKCIHPMAILLTKI